MDGKWIFIAGLGAGAALALRLSEKQIRGIKQFATEISHCENVEDAKRAVGDKVSQVMRQQGTNLVDKLAENLKQNLFADTVTTRQHPEASAAKSRTGASDSVIIEGRILS